MPAETKQIRIFLILVLTGSALFVYGVLFHSTSILPEKGPDQDTFPLSESALIRDVTVGGVRLEVSGKIRRTYTGKPPEACPT